MLPSTSVTDSSIRVHLTTPRADAALGRSTRKVQQAQGWVSPGLLTGCFQRLGKVFSRAEQQLKEFLDGRALLTAETLTPEADDVQASDAVRAHGRTEVWNVLTKAAIALDDAGVTNADELMKYRAATDKGVVTDVNVPR